MKCRKLINLIAIIICSFIFSCEKKPVQVKVTYRIIDFLDGFTVMYQGLPDTLYKEVVTGTYTLATPWTYEFIAEPGDFVYISLFDTVQNSYSKAQILFDGKIYKENTRDDDRFMPVVVSGIVPY